MSLSRNCWRWAACLGLVIGQSGCAVHEPASVVDAVLEDKTGTQSQAQEIYLDAGRAMLKHDYSGAIELYEQIEAQYPIGAYAAQAQLALIYAYYKNEDTVQALAAVERFMRLYPSHPKVDYALYMNGVISYVDNENRGIWGRFLSNRGHSAIDQDAAQAAIISFSDLLNRFPDSQYAPDSRARLEKLQRLLVQNELQIASFYLENKAYVAAVNRAVEVIESHAETPQVVLEALDILQQGYNGLGLDSLADDAAKLLNQKRLEHASSVVK